MDLLTAALLFSPIAWIVLLLVADFVLFARREK